MEEDKRGRNITPKYRRASQTNGEWLKCDIRFAAMGKRDESPP